MVTELDSISKNEGDICWEVHGSCIVFTQESYTHNIECTLYVTAESVVEAAQKAAEKMGAKVVIRKVFQVGQVVEGME